MPSKRIPIGIWWELPPGARWANEGVSRVVGFLIEGAAASGAYTFHLVVKRGVAAHVREDLRSLTAAEGVDWQVHEPTDVQERLYREAAKRNPSADAPIETIALALFANSHVPVDGWIVTFPHFTGSMWLSQSKAVLMPDAIPYDFPLGWADEWQERGSWPSWRRKVQKVCAASDAVINFSEHVADRHSVQLLGIPRSKIHVVPLAPPDLLPQLSFLSERVQTASSRATAAAIVRDHVANTGYDYLRNFPFEQCTFLVGATQDRPTKNLGLAADAVEKMIRRDRDDIKLLLTAPLHFGATWTRLPRIIEDRQLSRDLVSLPDLPRVVHAALFHVASLTIHTSFYEGIIGCLPIYESVSVGTPCILARGPHVDELLKNEPAFGPFTFDPNDSEGLISLIRSTLAQRDAVLTVQKHICSRLRLRTWSDVADGYVNAALARKELRAA